MLRLSAEVKRVRIRGVEDLHAIPGAGVCALDCMTFPQSYEIFERLCRSLGAHLGTTIEDCEPKTRDRDPAVLAGLLYGLRSAGCELWAVTVRFRDPAGDPSRGGGEGRDDAAPPLPRTRFFVTRTPERGDRLRSLAAALVR